MGAGRQPQGMHGADDRIRERLRHRPATETVAETGFGIDEDGEMNRRRIQAVQLQARIETGAITLVSGERITVAVLEIGADVGAAVRAVDPDEPPRLGVADRRRQCGEADQRLDQACVDRIGAEPAHIAPPAEQRFQITPEGGIEGGRGEGGIGPGAGFWRHQRQV